MNVSHTYDLGELKFVVTDNDEKVEVKVGKKTYAIYRTDLLDFCASVLGPVMAVSPEQPRQVVVEEQEEPKPRRPRLSDAPALEGRSAVSSAPVRQFTREDLARMELPSDMQTVDMTQLGNETVRFGR